MIEQMVKSISQLLPSDAAEEVKRNIETVVETQFERMNLVTKDQLEIQEKILRRARDRITELEQKIELLEAHVNHKENNDSIDA